MSQPAEKRMGVSDVRQNMTEVIAEVRLLGTPVVLTRRDKPQAALVSVDFYEQAVRDREIVEFLQERASRPTTGMKPDARTNIRVVQEALAAAERDVQAARNIAES